MTYSIEILASARKEWKKLDPDTKRQAVKKLEKLCSNPRVPSARLSGMANCYKVKLRGAGYRVIYHVIDQRLVILVIAAGKRDASKEDVYDTATKRMSELDGLSWNQ